MTRSRQSHRSTIKKHRASSNNDHHSNDDASDSRSIPLARRPPARLKRDGDEEEEDNDNDDDNVDNDAAAEAALLGLKFSSQAPELSQPIFPARATERGNLEMMGDEARQKAVLDLSRLILFKALTQEPIDRLKVLKEAGLSDKKISSAAFEEAASRLDKVFGFELKRPPKFIEKTLPSKFKDRYYVVNSVMADPAFSEHLKAIHAQDVESSVEKGVIMLVLAFCFCEGEARPDGSRWITDTALYQLLHLVDENIPSEPPSARSKKAHANAAAAAAAATLQSQRSSSRRAGRKREDDDDNDDDDDDDDNDDDDEVEIATPNIDFLLEKFVHLDYLLKERYNDEKSVGQQPPLSQSQQRSEEGTSFIYSMGPRAVMEIGRRQVISFCAEVLDEEIPESMLKEIEDDHEESEAQPMENEE